MAITYKWRKYSIRKSLYFSNFGGRATEIRPTDTGVYTDYKYDPDTDTFVGTDTISPDAMVYDNDAFYQEYGSMMSKFRIQGVQSGGELPAPANNSFDATIHFPDLRYHPGDFIEIVTSTSRSKYPDNDRDSGYWFIYDGIVNQPPTTPGAFTSPASGTVIDGKETSRYINWGDSSDDGNFDQYYLEYSLDGGSYQLYSSPVSSYDYVNIANIANSSNSTIRFRVRARDDAGAYSGYRYSDTYSLDWNSAPILSLNTTENRTLYENDTFTISGTATDTNSNDVVTVRYQINSEPDKAIATRISDGSAFSFNRALTFRQGKLYNGDTAVTGDLAEGTQHVLRVWAEDDQGGVSAEQVRTFYVVPNRPASLTIDPFAQRNDLINTDAVTISGNVSDPDNNGVTVKYKINNGSYVEVYNGQGGAFSFQVLLESLLVGVNTITIQATDSYGAITSKTLQVTKNENNQPLLTGVTRYKLSPPNGTASGIVLWIQREVGDLAVDVEVSMTAAGEAENFVPMTLESTAFVTDGIEEDEFIFDAAAPKENIVLTITETRSTAASKKAIKQISGVLS
jgi:hypothetical protein